MNKRFVNRNCLVDVLRITPELSAKEIQEFTGRQNISFDGTAVYIERTPGHGLCANYGDILVKDDRNNMYPIPEDIFKQQFVEVDEVCNNNLCVKWLGYNTNSVNMQLNGLACIERIAPDRTIILSNGIIVPVGHFIIYNPDCNVWSVVDEKTYNVLFRR